MAGYDKKVKPKKKQPQSKYSQQTLKGVFELLIEKRKEEHPDEPVFTIRDDFTMGTLLGQGAFATCHRATHK